MDLKTALKTVLCLTPFLAWTATAVANPLLRANEAYLAGDFRATVSGMVQALKEAPHDPLVREKALSLYSRALRAAGGNLPAEGFELPPEITAMKVGVRRTQMQTTKFALKVQGNLIRPKAMTQLQVLRYADRAVIVDKRAGIGEYEETVSPNDGVEYGLTSEGTPLAIEPGLYLLNIETANGNKTEGYFILTTDLNASTSPQFVSPGVDEVVRTGNPTFRFRNYVSPEFKAGERRSLWSGVFKVDANYDWKDHYGQYVSEPSIESLTVGPGGVFYVEGESNLPNGNYFVGLNYNETHSFGPLKISRASVTYRPFSVQK